MLGQTIDNLILVLSLIQQPAFCIRQDGTVVCNQAARPLAPQHGTALHTWLGPAANAWAAWKHSSTLELTVTREERTYTVTAEPLEDGTLFLLAACDASDGADSALSVASQVLRQPLTNLSAAVQLLSERPELAQLQDETASITRQLYQLTRLTGNLADLVRLRSGDYHLRLVLLDVNQYLEPLMQEVVSLCRSAGRDFLYTLLPKSVFLQADPMLLERAILNLVSNALKFSRTDTPIRCWPEVSGDHVLFRVRSCCGSDASEFLVAAFSRLEQRDTLPDPRWGIGLGLPITLQIARLHGGMTAVETDSDGWATVTLSMSRRRPLQAPVLASPAFEYTGGMRRTLVELSDVLPNQLYQTALL